MRRHGRVTSAFIRLLAGLCLAVGTAGMALAAGPDPAPRARIYLDWVLRTFDRTEKQIPAITRAAEVAAAGFIEGRDVGVRGGAGLNEELGARSGGLCVYRARKGGPGDVILYAFGVATQREPDVRVLLARELADAEALSEAGSPVIGLASYDQLEKYGLLDRARGACRVLMNNYCPAVDGLFQDLSGRPVIPTFTTANAIVSWVWMAEFFAACTREGKTPAMYQSVLADPDRKRYSKYLRVRFHDDMHVDPVPAGQFGKAYLESLRGLFRQVRTGQWDNLVQAAERAARTILDGGTIYSFARGHYPPYHHAGQLTVDPGLVEGLNMRKINSWRADDPEMPVPGTNDTPLASGNCSPPENPG